ncbi:hypothetical protein PLESTB_001291400 [Pleodorina starrii]|uniref:NAD(P)-binding domain-containing protein n=1 Tax=Pleodorina starrii TaxID=330485 RepID=A0A9W6BU44_9CHLO|nr:hypothetical protein PLESTM_000957500 [Pleodorina starrii]GLC57935.1 hypothetical protein PLESTB_001291400 [Pleodorina starrii]
MLCNVVRTCGHRPVTRSTGPRAVTLPRYRSITICRNKIGDELLDFVTAGPKLRKWYGAGERPTDGGEEQEPEEPDMASDVVFVSEADSPIGEQVVLQLILARQQLRLSVRDVAAAKTAYGPYATPVPADAATANAARMLRGVKCLVLLGRPPRGLLEAAAAARGVRHVVLLSAAPSAASSSGGFSLGGFSLGGGGGGGAASRELRELADGAAEAAVRASGLPYTVVQVYGLQEQGRGGSASGGVALTRQQQPAGATTAGGKAAAAAGVSREALGALLSGLVDAVPERGRTLQAVGASSSGASASALSPSVSPQSLKEALEETLAGLGEDA